MRRLIVGPLMVGVLSLGIAVPAYAGTSTHPTTTTDHHADGCKRALAALPGLEKYLANTEALIAKLQEYRAKAVAAGKTELVGKIDAQLAKQHAMYDKLETIIAYIHSHCDATTPPV